MGKNKSRSPSCSFSFPSWLPGFLRDFLQNAEEIDPVREPGRRWRRTMKAVRNILSFAPWTLGWSVAILALNAGLITGAPDFTLKWPGDLEYDRAAVLDGGFLRLFTGNLVHWSSAHLFLDVGAFFVVGALFERSLGRVYPLFLAASGIAVGLSLLLFAPEVTLYRGLSGVASGQLAVVVWNELRQTADRKYLFCIALAGIVFAFCKKSLRKPGNQEKRKDGKE